MDRRCVKIMFSSNKKIFIFFDESSKFACVSSKYFYSAFISVALMKKTLTPLCIMKLISFVYLIYIQARNTESVKLYKIMDLHNM